MNSNEVGKHHHNKLHPFRLECFMTVFLTRVSPFPPIDQTSGLKSPTRPPGYYTENYTKTWPTLSRYGMNAHSTVGGALLTRCLGLTHQRFSFFAFHITLFNSFITSVYFVCILS